MYAQSTEPVLTATKLNAANSQKCVFIRLNFIAKKIHNYNLHVSSTTLKKMPWQNNMFSLNLHIQSSLFRLVNYSLSGWIEQNVRRSQ